MNDDDDDSSRLWQKIEDKADSAFHIFVVYWHLARNFFQKNDAWFYFTGIVFLTFFSNHQPIRSFTLEVSAWHIVKEYQNVTHKLPESLLLFLRVPIRLVPVDYILLLNVLIFVYSWSTKLTLEAQFFRQQQQKKLRHSRPSHYHQRTYRVVRDRKFSSKEKKNSKL